MNEHGADSAWCLAGAGAGAVAVARVGASAPVRWTLRLYCSGSHLCTGWDGLQDTSALDAIYRAAAGIRGTARAPELFVDSDLG